ncbi:hypothetical protein NDU88_005422 [Pleurodeles waltl]|uniref:Putative nuclease HARBI1 n=1 Tax=Pleurodeles waltl TaxID=8319 RepID=A0AAV7VLN6_PLEWA|nr:hypothetical protein NDU88_005422 [Pleurodeles waltl]
MTHGREAELENDRQPNLRQKLMPGNQAASCTSHAGKWLFTNNWCPRCRNVTAIIFCLLPKVLDAISGLTPRHIRFPNTLQKQQETKQGFYLISRFPHVLGAIDCTHVRLVPPAATEHLYRNRKHTHSINVQAIVDHQGLFTNIVAKYPGSVHDSFICCHSTINQHFQDGRYGNGLLVADQGYGIQPWILTLFGNPSTTAERAYNDADRRTRSIVERTFGILKSRFRCLDITGGSLLYSPEMVWKIILTCAILHNFCIRRNIPFLEPEPHMPEEEEEEDGGLQHEGNQQNTAAGVRRRQHIVNNFLKLITITTVLTDVNKHR